MTQSINVVCPNCSAVNRLPEERLVDRPVCGRCKEHLFRGQPLDLDASNFDRYLSREDLPLLIDFWAPWCGPCKMMAPAYAGAAKKLEPRIRAAKINTENEQALGARYNIRSIPTLALFKNGGEVARQAGAMSEADIIRWANANA